MTHLKWMDNKCCSITRSNLSHMTPITWHVLVLTMIDRGFFFFFIVYFKIRCIESLFSSIFMLYFVILFTRNCRRWPNLIFIGSLSLSDSIRSCYTTLCIDRPKTEHVPSTKKRRRNIYVPNRTPYTVGLLNRVK